MTNSSRVQAIGTAVCSAMILCVVITACAVNRAAWPTVGTDYLRLSLDTASLHSVDDRYAVARMEVRYRRNAEGGWRGHGRVLQFDFDCYALMWRESDRARRSTASSEGWFSLNHNLLNLPIWTWNRLGDDLGAFPYSYVCREAGLINEQGDFIGDDGTIRRTG